MANQNYIAPGGGVSFRKATGAGTDLDPFISSFSDEETQNRLGSTSATAAASHSATASIGGILKGLWSHFGLSGDAASTTGSLMARIRAALDRMGSFGDAASSTGSVMAQLRYIGDSLNRVTTCTVINESTSGDRTIIAATAGQSIRITSLYFTVDGSAAITLKNGSTAISGAMQITDHASDYPVPVALSTNTAFVMNVSAIADVRGYVVWYLV